MDVSHTMMATVPFLCTLLIVLLCGPMNAGGVKFFLGDESMPSDSIITITDIGSNDTDALICRSELSSSEVNLGGSDWYLAPTDVISTSSSDRILSEDPRGWARNRATDANSRALVRLKRTSDTATEGQFTCEVPGDVNNTLTLLILHPISGTVSIVVVSAKLGTFKVTCTATGGILSTSSLTGPGLSSEGLSLTLQGDDSRTGQNVYSATSGTLVVQSNGDEYTCNVTNDVSSSESSVKLKKAGDPLLMGLVQISSTSLRVTWTSPIIGATVTGYVIHYRSGVIDSSLENLLPTSTTADITGLISGGTYTVSVEAVSIHLSGESAGMTITLDFEGVPDAPEGVHIDGVTPNPVMISWEAVQNANSYTVAFSQTRNSDQLGLCSASHMASVSVDTHTVSIDVGQNVADSVTTMLRAYTTYSITVVAVNDHGSSKESESIKYTTVQTSAAVAIGNIRAVVDGPNNISVQWDGLSPCRLVNGLIVEYRVQYTVETSGVVESTDVPGEWMNGADTKLTGLTPFTSYSIKVAAINEQGHVGLYSNPIIKQTEEDVPGPVIITPVPSFFQITITWNEPAMPNGVITEYEVSYGMTGCRSSQSVANTDLDTSFTVFMSGNLELGTEFTFTVIAYTRVGPGEPATIAVSTLTRPPPVQGVMVMALSETSVNVSWNELVIPQVSIDNYTVVYSLVAQQQHNSQSDETRVLLSPLEISLVVSDLSFPAVYQFQVFATATVRGTERAGERSNITFFINFGAGSQTCSDSSEAVTNIIITAIVSVIVLTVGVLSLLVIAIITTWRKRSKVATKSTGMCSSTANPSYGLSLTSYSESPLPQTSRPLPPTTTFSGSGSCTRTTHL